MRVTHCLLSALAFVLCYVSPVFATQEDVRGINLQPPENKIIDEKCLGCHNRQKINAAVKQRKNMEKIVTQMETKGAVLTDADRQVLGHFWQQNPLKKTR